MLKNLTLVAMGLSLVACSATGEKNTFMAYDDLQKKVRSHDEQWQNLQAKLDRIDALEAEVAALKREKEEAMMLAETATQGEPVAIETVFPVDSNASSMVQDSGLLEARAMAEKGLTAEHKAMADKASMIDKMESAPQKESSMLSDGVLPTQNMPVQEEPVKAEPEYAVQIAAYRNKDEVTRGWRVLLQKDPNTFQTLQPLIDQKVVRGTTMYLLKAGPFINRSYSNDFCTGLKSKGTDCLVTEYKGESFTVN